MSKTCNNNFDCNLPIVAFPVGALSSQAYDDSVFSFFCFLRVARGIWLENDQKIFGIHNRDFSHRKQTRKTKTKSNVRSAPIFLYSIWYFGVKKTKFVKTGDHSGQNEKRPVSKLLLFYIFIM